MTNAILARHPLATLSMDSDLALILECEDPLLMNQERLTEIITTPKLSDEVEPEVWGYLVGLLEQRLYCRTH